MKEFTTDKATDEDRPRIDFNLDGTILTARKPKTAAFLHLVTTNDDEGQDQAQGVMDFVRGALTPESRKVVLARLDDPDDDLDISGLVPLVNWVIEEFTGDDGGGDRPTGPSNGSSPPRKRTGSSSTARSRSRASTPAASPSSDSSTP